MRYDALFRGRGDQNNEKFCYVPVTKVCDPYTTVNHLFLVNVLNILFWPKARVLFRKRTNPNSKLVNILV